MYKTVLFDLDGTLTDPGRGITNSVAYSLRKFGIEVEDKKELYKFIGPPLYESFMKYYGFSKKRQKPLFHISVNISEIREFLRTRSMTELKIC